MDSKSLLAVRELGALCKEEKRMWALAAFESDWGSSHEPVEQVVPVPVKQAVPVPVRQAVPVPVRQAAVEPEEVVPPPVRILACSGSATPL